MQKIFNFLIEAGFWIALFACPLFIGGAVALIVYAHNPQMHTLSIVVFGCGVLGGVILAEYMRRKYGCSGFFAKLLGN